MIKVKFFKIIKSRKIQEFIKGSKKNYTFVVTDKITKCLILIKVKFTNFNLFKHLYPFTV